MNIKYSQLADRLGEIKAQIADLAEIEKSLKEKIVALNCDVAQGDFFRAAVSDVEREILDMDAVRAQLSRQFIVAHTSVSRSTVVRVSARKTVAA